MVLQDEIQFQMGDQFDMRSHGDVAEDMTLDGCVDVTLELANEIFMTWKKKCELEGEFEEELDGAL